MAYICVKDFIPTSLHPLKAPYVMAPQFITLHNTWNDATARNEVAYMKRNKTSTGYHVAIDDKEAIEAIPFNRNAWHAGDGNGDGNRKSIGIEICYSRSGGDKYRQAEANAIEYTAQLLKEYGWSIDNVKWHRDWSGKNCPHRILDEGRASAVRKEIADRLAELTKPAEVKSATQTKGTFRIKTGTFANARSLADAIDRVKADFGWVTYESADSAAFNPTYRIYTGSFSTKESAESAQAKLKARYGWTTHLIDETK